jgi:Zn2+/Cd2+-exporting ATPase
MIHTQDRTILLKTSAESGDARCAQPVANVRTAPAVRQTPRSRSESLAEQARETAVRRTMAILTAVCLAGLILGVAGEWSKLLSHPAAIVIYVIAYSSGGYHSVIRAGRDLCSGTVSVDLLMIVAALGAAAVDDWPEGAFLLFLFSLSNTLEQYVLGRTRRALRALMDLSPDQAVVLRDHKELQVAVEELRLGDTLIVRPAERIAADGVIVSGSTSIDQSAMTGESIPVEKGRGDSVFAGTLNQQGAIEVRVTRLAAESTLARIVTLVEQAQSERAQSQRFTDWFGRRYTVGVLSTAALTLIVPLVFFGASFGSAFYRAMTLLVAASPCAVVLSIPAAILTAITSAARGGVLFKGGAHLEQMATLQAIAFDKTGTLTLGRPQVTDVCPMPGIDADHLLRLAGSAEKLSEHPLAHALGAAVRARGLELLPAMNFQALPGRGLRAKVNDCIVWIGKPELFTSCGVSAFSELTQIVNRLAAAGRTPLIVGVGCDANNSQAPEPSESLPTRLLGVLAVADTIRSSTPQALARLRELGIAHLTMLTGDNERVAQAIAGRLGISFEAELLPADKLRSIQALRAKYGSVAMVGDGINDAPSLAAANLGISLGGAGTDVALETADVVLMADDLLHLPYAVALARQTQRIIRQNLIFALGVILFLLIGTFFGSLRLPFAVLGHEGSTVLVVLNGLRLLAFPRPEPRRG